MLRYALALSVFACCAQAHAQLRLPGGLGQLPGVPTVNSPLSAASRLPDLAGTDVPLQPLRQRVVQELLREHAARVEADPAGEPVLRGELLAVQPTDAWMASAAAQGFRVLREQRLEALALRTVVLAPPAGLSTREGLERLRAIDPTTEVDFQHLYTRSGDLGPSRTAPETTITPGGATAPPSPRRIGLIDDGVDRAHPALRAAPIVASGCQGAAAPGVHGTAIASLLVGRDGAFTGLLPRDATLYAADVYCGQAVGGSVEAVVQALGWMTSERVAVVNVSLVGPPNRLLEHALRAMATRGHLVVAAVGNDGPAAPPLYPAAYPEVVGVTAVAPTRRALPEAARGPHVAFAAPGSELAVAQAGSAAYAVARGTSFAAPFVAGMLAHALAEPDPALARRALERLAAQATDLGSPGRDPVFGWGLVAEQARNAPSRVQAMLRSRP